MATSVPRSASAPGLESITAVVLAAGRGKRLRPATDRVPKALLEVRGEVLLDYHLRLLREAGVARAVVVVGYLADRIRRHLAARPPPCLSVEVVEQPAPCGTGDAVRCALARTDSDPFLVVYSDVYWGPEATVYADLVGDRTAKIVGARVADGGSFGRLAVVPGTGGPVLRGIREKDGAATPGLVNAGAYLLPRALEVELDRLALSPRGEAELTDAVVSLGRRRPVRVVVVPSWVDIGTPDRWAEANGVPT